ncbi:hypothetical protein M5E87_13970 [Flavonifractor plautii]|nr:hypothetical protein M5E87_13970 [Flavonifractor plautii]
MKRFRTSLAAKTAAVLLALAVGAKRLLVHCLYPLPVGYPVAGQRVLRQQRLLLRPV